MARIGGCAIERAAAGGQLVEALWRRAYEARHLPGAISILRSTLDPRAATRLRPDRPVTACCADLSARAAARLEQLRFAQVFRYAAGKEKR